MFPYFVDDVPIQKGAGVPLPCEEDDRGEQVGLAHSDPQPTTLVSFKGWPGPQDLVWHFRF